MSSDKGDALLTFPEAPPAFSQAGCGRAVAAIAPGQPSGLATAAEHQALLASGSQVHAFGAADGAIGQLRGTAAAAEQAAVAGLEQADFGKHRVRHEWGSDTKKAGEECLLPPFAVDV